MQVDYRSDTLTLPTPGMQEAMWAAKLGDDVFGEDPTVNALEDKAAHLFGKEAALFCPSGTMTNQIAIKTHTQPGDEVICDGLSHIYRYEGGGVAFNAGCSVRLLEGSYGRLNARLLDEAVNPDDPHFPKSRLVSLENTSNKGGGSVYAMEDLVGIRQFCTDHELNLHLDGARLFNALVSSGQESHSYGELFDSISICLSKGLGCPVGSLLLGSHAFIKQARRIRKVFGGGMRQAGFMAAAGIYALDNHVGRLSQDHKRAKALEEALGRCSMINGTLPVSTNIVVGKLDKSTDVDLLLSNLNAKGIKAVRFGPKSVRFVTHLDISDRDIDYTAQVLQNM